MMSGLRQIYSLFVAAGLDAFEGKPVPNWLKNHPEFQKRKKVDKVFPVFGLNNFTEKVKYKTKDTREQDSIIERMLSDMYSQGDRIYYEILSMTPTDPSNYDAQKAIDELTIFMRNAINGIFNARTVREDGKTKILFDDEVKLGTRLIFRQGESVFHAFNKINDIIAKFLKKHPNVETETIPLSQLNLPNPDSLPNVKLFHKVNVPNRDYYVVFSGSGDQGAWDVCTMSARGIQSCQTLTESPTEYNTALIGSILSRYVGIIYLTSGLEASPEQAKYGTKMIKRCLVRFAINTANNKERVIILDKMYDSHDPVIAEMFVQALKKRTKLKVLDFSSDVLSDPELPMIHEVKIPGEKTLRNLKPEEQPYKDLPFLAQQPAEYREKWKRDPVNASGILNTKRREIYHEAVNDLNSSIDMLVDQIIGSRNKEPTLGIAILYKLDENLHQLISRTQRMTISYELRVKYIQKKMEGVFRRFTHKEPEQVKEDESLEFVDTDPETLEPRQMDREFMKRVILEAVTSYKLAFYNMFK